MERYYSRDAALLRDGRGFTPGDYYEILSSVWCAETCAPRMRDDWTPENRTLGQCSVTAFLMQDFFGGKVRGIPLPDGGVHCFNEVGKAVFDLTCAQFGEEKLDYSDCAEQDRAVHFSKEEKRIRYETLKERLLRALGETGSGEEIRIREARLSDASDLLRIYAPYVQDTAVTFEYEVPSEEAFRERMERIMKRYPYLVLTRGGKAVGYAYAGPFHERPAYGWCCETSVYLDREIVGRGLGNLLCGALEREAERMGILSLYACVAVPEREDETLTNRSERFHEKRGYAPVGTFRRCGYKFGRWYDMVYLEKTIGERTENPAPVTDYPRLRETGRD